MSPLKCPLARPLATRLATRLASQLARQLASLLGRHLASALSWIAIAAARLHAGWRRFNSRTGRTGWMGAAMAAWLASVMAATALSGCGGGVGEGGTGYASGPITGFGSVIVNDLVFDDSLALVEDGDGGRRARADLRLGMTVEIESDAIVGSGARASRVRFDSAVVGPVESLEADGFVVLGQRVAVDATTVFDSALAAGLAAVQPGQLVEVYGLYDGLGRFRATRVERRTAVLAYRLRGLVNGIDEGTKTLRIGTGLFAYAAAASTPSDLAVGSFVRLLISTDPPGLAGRRQVLHFGEVQRPLLDVDGCSVKGHVTRFTSLSDFRVDGRPVDASAAEVNGGPLAFGTRVEVIGSLRAGVLVATRVEVRSDQFERDRLFELRGPIDTVAADRTSMQVRGITVDLTRPQLVFVDGTAASLVAGRQVEVRGVVSVGDGTRLDALLVKFR